VSSQPLQLHPFPLTCTRKSLRPAKKRFQEPFKWGSGLSSSPGESLELQTSRYRESGLSLSQQGGGATSISPAAWATHLPSVCSPSPQGLRWRRHSASEADLSPQASAAPRRKRTMQQMQEELVMSCWSPHAVTEDGHVE